MSKLRTEKVNIIAEFVGALMKAHTKRGAKKTLKKIQNDPVIKKSLDKIAKIDMETQKDIERRIKRDPAFKKEFEKNVAKGL